MSKEKLEAMGFTVKANGKIDFSKPPKGKEFCAAPLENDDDYNLLTEDQRRFVTMHRFNARLVRCKMEVVDIGTGKSYNRMNKNDYKKEERKCRCKLISPKTGREIWCPDSLSCYGDNCPKKLGVKVVEESDISMDEFADYVYSRGMSYDTMEDEILDRIMWSTFKEKLRAEEPQLVKIITWTEEGRGRNEILTMCKKREDQTSWYYYQLKKIKSRWDEYNQY